jgi:hypothetical protein
VYELCNGLADQGWLIHQGNCFERDRVVPYRELLDPQAAHAEFEQALRLAREVGSGNWTTVIGGSLASLLLSSGNTKAAADLLQQIVWCPRDSWAIPPKGACHPERSEGSVTQTPRAPE